LIERSWEAEGARIAVVQHHEVEHRRRLQLAEIAPAVADGAVAEFERQPHGRIPVDRRLLEWPERRAEHELRPLDAPTEVEEQPAGAAGHILLRQTGQGGDKADDVVEGAKERIEVAA
jgi:hypothetical protein